MTKYKVRSFALHKEIFEDGKKSLQSYRPGATVELTDEEFDKYKHLVEPMPKTSTTTKTTKKEENKT